MFEESVRERPVLERQIVAQNQINVVRRKKTARGSTHDGRKITNKSSLKIDEHVASRHVALTCRERTTPCATLLLGTWVHADG